MQNIVIAKPYRFVPPRFSFAISDLQYIINPGTDPAHDNAWVAGLRFEFSWSNEPG